MFQGLTWKGFIHNFCKNIFVLVLFICNLYLYLHHNIKDMETSKKIIAFTDLVNECECCGKKGLKGTFCVNIDGNEFYFGSICTFKKHGFEKGSEKNALSDFQKLQFATKRGFSSLVEQSLWQEKQDKMIEEWANN